MFWGFQAFLESFQCQDCPTKNIKKQMLFLMFFGFQALLESFKSQDCHAKELKKTLVF